MFEQDIVESFEGCQSAGNEAIMDKNFWTFVTLDVTPLTYMHNLQYNPQLVIMEMYLLHGTVMRL